MTQTEQREAARQFYNKWNGKGREDEDARSYWIDILQDVLNMDKVTDRVEFEKRLSAQTAAPSESMSIFQRRTSLLNKSLSESHWTSPKQDTMV